MSARRQYLKFTGDQLRLLRLVAGLHQSELAEAAGLHRVTVSYYEGKRRLPATEEAEKLFAKALELCPVASVDEEGIHVFLAYDRP